MPIFVFLFAAAAVASVPLFIWALHDLRPELSRRQRGVVRDNLQSDDGRLPSQRQLEMDQSPSDRIMQPVLAWATKIARQFTPSQWLAGLERRRALAGETASWSMDRLLAMKVLGGITGAFLFFVVFSSDPSLEMFVVGSVLLVVGFMAPDLVLGSRGRKRQAQIEREFPVVLDRLVTCVNGGLGLDAAMARIVEAGSGPLADELAHVLQDVQLGASREAAFDALLERTDVADIRHFVVAMKQANRYGIPITQTLRIQATEARERRRANSEEHAQKMAVKLLFPLIFCILPALFVVLLGPAAIRIAQLNLAG
jgi:tight adherence protein C